MERLEQEWTAYEKTGKQFVETAGMVHTAVRLHHGKEERLAEAAGTDEEEVVKKGKISLLYPPKKKNLRPYTINEVQMETQYSKGLRKLISGDHCL